jgi:hypothetical protein
VQNIRRNLVASIDPGQGTTPLQLSLVAGSVFVGLAVSGCSLAGSGGTPAYAYSIISGSLPTGLSLNTSTGAITGTPSTQGVVSFVAQITDAGSNTYARAFSINVRSALQVLQGGGTPVPGRRNVFYSFQFRVGDLTGSTAGVTYTLPSGSLPSGLSLSSGGLISGTPTATGTSTFTVRATKAGAGTLDIPCTLSISTMLTLSAVFTLPTRLRNMTIGVEVDEQVQLTGVAPIGKFVWSITAGALPSGLSMDSNGRVTGIPDTPTASTYTQPTITITETKTSATRSFTPSGANSFAVKSSLASSTRGRFYTTGLLGDPTDLDIWSGYFGGGGDGAFVLNGTNTYPLYFSLVGSVYTQLRPLYASSLTLGAGITWDTAGAAWYITGNLDVTAAGSKIRNNGNNASGTSGGALKSSWWGQTPAGGNGGVGAATGSIPGTAASPSSNNSGNALAGNGGLGGAGTGGGSSGVGGAASSSTYLTSPPFPIRAPFQSLQLFFGWISGGQSGGGGGAGGGNGTLAGANGGGGGSAGCVLYGFANTITTSASTSASLFSAIGGNGANGTAAPGTGRGAGAGGGGASGGIVWIVCVFRDGPAVTNLIDVSGGNAGLKGATGSGNAANDGIPGDSGFAFGFVLSTQTAYILDSVQHVGTTGGVGKLTF